MKRVAIVALLTVNLAVPWAVKAQERDVTHADSLAIRITSLEILLDSLLPTSDERLLWLESQQITDSTGSAIIVPSPAEAEAVRAANDRVRILPLAESAFECGPGQRARMPLSGCPIRDGGVILQFGRLSVVGDSLQTIVSATQSSADGTQSWLHGLQLLFLHIDGRWTFAAILGHYMT